MFMFYVITLFLLSLNNLCHVYTAPVNNASSTQPVIKSAYIHCLKEYKPDPSVIGNTRLAKLLNVSISSFETGEGNLDYILYLIPNSDIPCISFCVQNQIGVVDEKGHIVEEIFYSYQNISNEDKPKFDECYQRTQNVSTNVCERSIAIELCTNIPETVQYSLDGGMKLSEVIYLFDVFTSPVLNLAYKN